MNNQTASAGLPIQIREYWQIVERRKWIVLLAGALLSAAVVTCILLMPNWYMASITVSVDPQKMPDRYLSSTVTSDQLRFDTLSEQVLNAPRLQQVINELNLYPELRGRITQDELVNYMRSNILVQIKQGGDRNPSTFTIRFTGKNRLLVPTVATRLAECFIEWDLAMRERQATGASKFLARQLEEARERLEKQEGKVNQFRRQHLGELPEQAGSNSAALARLQMALQANIDNLNRLEQDKILLKVDTPSERKEPIQPERARLLEQEQRLSAELADLKSRYSDEYPDVVHSEDKLTLVRQRLAKLPDPSLTPQQSQEPSASRSMRSSAARELVINNEIARLQAEQREILAGIKDYQAKVEAVPLREQELNELGRDYRNSTIQYQSMLDKSLTAEMSEEMERTQEANRFSILEPAQMPDKPFKPHRLLWIAFGIPACFLIAAFLKIFVDIVVRGTIGTERALQSLLPDSIPVLGRIPETETVTEARRQRQVAIAAVSGSLICCLLISLALLTLHARA